MSSSNAICRVDWIEMINGLSELNKLPEKEREIPENFWKKYLAIGIFFFFTFFYAWSSTYQSVLFLLFGLSSTVIIFTGILYYRPNPIFAWCLIGAGQFFHLIGDFIYKWQYHFQQGLVFEDISKYLYFLGMVSFLIGLFVSFTIFASSFIRLI
jgi:hypothetical protein